MTRPFTVNVLLISRSWQGSEKQVESSGGCTSFPQYVSCPEHLSNLCFFLANFLVSGKQLPEWPVSFVSLFYSKLLIPIPEAKRPHQEVEGTKRVWVSNVSWSVTKGFWFWDFSFPLFSVSAVLNTSSSVLVWAPRAICADALKEWLCLLWRSWKCGAPGRLKACGLLTGEFRPAGEH